MTPGCALGEEFEYHSATKGGSSVVSELLKFLICLGFRRTTQESVFREGTTTDDVIKMSQQERLVSKKGRF